MKVSKTRFISVPFEDSSSDSKRAFAHTNDSLIALNTWLTSHISYGDLIKQGRASLYQFVGPPASALPVNLSLNHIDMSSAEIVDDATYKRMIKWLQLFDSNYLINSQYEAGGMNYEWNKKKYPDSVGIMNLKGATGREIMIFKLPPADTVPSDSVDLIAEPCDTTVNEWVLSSEEILQRLENNTTNSEDRVTAVLFAETTAFSQPQQPRLIRALFDFCDQNRFSRNDEVITAVGSAIRKLAMNMPACEFESYSRLFLPTETNTLSCEIELELAKAVGWRLAKLKNLRVGEYPDLEARLSELASDYLTARLILQENYASIVIHAAIAVGLLRGARQDEFIDRIANLRVEWFSNLFARRLLDVARKREEAASEDADNLIRLLQRLTAAGR